MDDDTDGEAEEAVDLAHPFRISLREVVVDGDDVDAAAGQGVEVGREGGDEGLAFAGLHLRDLALVKDGAADDLDVEVAHADGATAGLADDGEGLRHEGVEGGLFSGVEGFGVGLWGRCLRWLRLRAGGTRRFCRGSCSSVRDWIGRIRASLTCLNDGHEALDGAVVGGTEDFGDDGVDHEGILKEGEGDGRVALAESAAARAEPWVCG